MVGISFSCRQRTGLTTGDVYASVFLGVDSSSLGEVGRRDQPWTTRVDQPSTSLWLTSPSSCAGACPGGRLVQSYSLWRTTMSSIQTSMVSLAEVDAVYQNK